MQLTGIVEEHFPMQEHKQRLAFLVTKHCTRGQFQLQIGEQHLRETIHINFTPVLLV